MAYHKDDREPAVSTPASAPSHTLTSTAARLICDLARCPAIAQWYGEPAGRASHPCHAIINYQVQGFGARTRDDFQLPEPWQGDIGQARVLFISSNPSIRADGPDRHPRWPWADDRIIRTFADSFEAGIIDGVRAWTKDGRLEYVRYWGEVRARARELLGVGVRPGRDYALTEVVHCKSVDEIGVYEAQDACAERWLRKVLSVSVARVLVVLGRPAQPAMTRHVIELGVPAGQKQAWGTVLGPVNVVGRDRMVVFLPHPNARMKRSLAATVTAVDLARLQAFVRAGGC